MSRRTSILADRVAVEMAISKSCSIQECLCLLGLRAAGSNYTQFYRWCKIHGLHPPVVDRKAISARVRENSTNVVPLDQILTNPCRVQVKSTRLKERLVEEGRLKPVCQVCGLSGEWMQKPLKLQLDHVDGDGKNNDIGNLRLLCPNCHSQTETFCGKNVKYKSMPEKPGCGVCGNKIAEGNQSGLCKTCYVRTGRSRKAEWPDLDLLREQAKTSSHLSLGKRYGVSGTTIKKWLNRD